MERVPSNKMNTRSINLSPRRTRPMRIETNLRRGNPYHLAGIPLLLALSLGLVDPLCSNDSRAIGTFEVRVEPGSISIQQGSVGIVQVFVDRVPGYDRQILLSVNFPEYPGVTAEFSDTVLAISDRFATLSISVDPSAELGRIAVYISARDTFPPPLTRSWELTLTVTSTAQPSNWVEVFRTPAGEVLHGMDFGADVGLAVGNSGLVYRSTDRGESWNRLAGISDEAPLVDVSLAGQIAILVSSGGSIYRSEDAGTTWSLVPGVSSSLNAVESDGGQYLIVVGPNGYITRSEDAGVTWTSVSSGTSWALRGINMFNLTATTAGENGVILRSTDRGVTWFAQTSGTTAFLDAVDFVNEDFGIVMGISGGSLLITSDGGQSWEPRGAASVYLNEVDILNSTTATVAGGWNVFQTIDGGQTWTQDSVTAPIGGSVISDIHLFDDNTGVCLVPTPNGTVIMKRR